MMVRLSYVCFVAVVLVSIRTAQGCGGALTVGEMTILTSPDYPNSAAEKDNTYPSNADCTWENRGAGNTLNMLKFLDYRIEIGEDDSNITCDFDFVSIETTGGGDQKFCGYTTYEEPIIGLGTLTIKFQSDESMNLRGFKLGYKITPNYDPCEDFENCGDEGRCYSEDRINPLCRCIPGTTGEFCEVDIRECQSNPCQNGGRCDDSERKNHYKCECSEAFLGYNCDQARPRPCDSNPCRNDGQCQELPGWTHKCNCLEFFAGDACERESGCKNPGLPGLDENKRYHTGTKVEFNCSVGFEMLGQNTSECQENTRWTSGVPECKEIIIPDPYEGVFFTPFVQFMFILSGLFLTTSLLLGLWLKFRGPWVPLPENYGQKSHTSSSMTSSVDELPDVDDEDADELPEVKVISGSEVSDDVFESVHE